MSIVKKGDYLPTWPKFLEDFFNRDIFDWSTHNFSTTNTTLPTVNIKEIDNEFVVEMAAPGMAKEDFKIELNNGKLTIKSEKQENSEKQTDSHYTRREFSYQSFCRSFTVPESVDANKISARYENGILYLTMPKREESKPKPPRLIEIG